MSNKFMHAKTKKELSRTIQQHKKNVLEFHRTIEKNHEEIEQAKRIEAARNAGYQLDIPEDEEKPNALIPAFWCAAIMIVVACIILMVI